MKIEQKKWIAASGWTPGSGTALAQAQLVLVFGANAALKKTGLLDEIKKMYPAVRLLGCSTAGEICGTQVSDDSVVATAVHFESTLISGVRVGLDEVADSFLAGERLA